MTSGTERYTEELERRERYLARKRDRMPRYMRHTEDLAAGQDPWEDIREARHNQEFEHPGFRVIPNTGELPIIVVDDDGEAVVEVDDSIEPVVIKCRACGVTWSSHSEEERQKFFEDHRHGTETMNDGTTLR
jgi:hypothetical protein